MLSHSRIQVHDKRVDEHTMDVMLTLCAPGLTMPWAPVDYPIAAKVMKTALDQGANLWNGVSCGL